MKMDAKRKVYLIISAVLASVTVMVSLSQNVYATIGGESMERQFRESMLRNNPHLKPEDIVCCGYFDANGNEVTRDEFAVLITQAALDGASPEFRATHSVTSEGIIVNNATGLPDPVNSRGVPITNTSSQKTQKEKVTAYFTDFYGTIVGSSKITKGTTIAKSQFPKKNPSDIVVENTIFTFDKWEYAGNVLDSDVIVKALYKVKQ